MTKTKLLIASAALLASTVLPLGGIRLLLPGVEPLCLWLGQLRLLLDGNADRAPSMRFTHPARFLVLHLVLQLSRALSHIQSVMSRAVTSGSGVGVTKSPRRPEFRASNLSSSPLWLAKRVSLSSRIAQRSGCLSPRCDEAPHQ